MQSVRTGTFLYGHYDYYKVYVDTNNDEISREETTYEQYQEFEALTRKLYGYMRFNWSTMQNEFVPGTLRKTLPVVTYPPGYA